MIGSDFAVELQHLVAVAEGEYRDSAVDEVLERLAKPLELDESQLQRLRDHVLRVRVASERRRWRELQLQALIDTAQHLLSTSAIDELLDEIVAAAQRLMPCDVAHINLGTQDDQILERSRSLRGETSPAWRLHSPSFDSGVTGKVFATKRPVTTASYLDDRSFAHTVSADDAIRDDGISALAAVPVRRGGEVVGVLVASWRSARQTSAEELSLLGSLAALVGAGLEGARLEWQRRAAVDEVSTVNERFRAVNEMLEWSAALHDRLITLSLEGADLLAAANELSVAFQCAVAIQDEVTGGTTTTDQGFQPDYKREEFGGSDFFEYDGRLVFACRTTSAEAQLATLVLDRHALTSTERRGIERAAVICALLVANRRELADARFRDESSVVRDLIYGRYKSPPLGSRYRQIAGMEEGCTVVAVDLARQDHRTRAAVRDAAGRLDALVGEIGDFVALLVPSTRSGSIAEILERAFRRAAVEPVAGVDGPAKGFADIPGSYERAVACARAASALSGNRRIVSTHDLGFVGLLLASDRTTGVDAFIAQTIGPILEYDARKGSDLILTLQAYLAAGSSLQGASSAMLVHPNTAYQRLQRVTKLIGEDWREPERIMQVQLAIHLHHMRASSL